MIRFSMLALLGTASLPAIGQTPTMPPAVAPTLTPPLQVQPIPLPAPIPPLSGAQEAWLNGWLRTGMVQGLMARSKATANLTGEALVNAALDRAKALSTGRVDTADFLDIWALRPARYDLRPSLAKAVAEDRLPQWAATLTPPYAGYDGLRKGLATYEGIRDKGGWPVLTAKSAPDVVRARIALEDKSVAPGEKLARCCNGRRSAMA